MVAAEEVPADQPLPERRRETVARVATLGGVPAVGVRVLGGPDSIINTSSFSLKNGLRFPSYSVASFFSISFISVQ